MRPIAGLLAVIFITGCGTTAGWTAGAAFVTENERPGAPLRAEDVRVSLKDDFGAFETTEEKKQQACRSTTLLRKAGLISPELARDSRLGERSSDDAVEAVAHLTTDELPRDEDASKLIGREFTRVLGIGNDELDMFAVAPSKLAVTLGIRKLREQAAAIGADEVRDVFFTGYAEHQMFEGSAVSLTPTSTSSPFYAHIVLLELKLRDVRLHGTAVRRKVNP